MENKLKFKIWLYVVLFFRISSFIDFVLQIELLQNVVEVPNGFHWTFYKL